jgi:hypothetical protein
MRGGAAFYAIPKVLTLSLDVDKERDSDATLHVGGEYIYNHMFALRGGYQKGTLSLGEYAAALSQQTDFQPALNLSSRILQQVTIPVKP